MWNDVRSLYKNLKAHLVQPTALCRLIKSAPDLAAAPQVHRSSIHAHDVLQWEDWNRGDPVTSQSQPADGLQGWQYTDGQYRGPMIRRPDLGRFVQCDRIENWQVDIQQIQGFSNSKSNLARFSDMDLMVTTNSPEMIEPMTEQKLQENLAWREIRILQDPRTTDHFVRYHWDGRVFLFNSGGSHHLAAARYMARNLGLPVPVRGLLKEYSFNKTVVADLQREFELFVVAHSDHWWNFHEAMEAFRATYFWRHLPRPCHWDRVVFLP